MPRVRGSRQATWRQRSPSGVTRYSATASHRLPRRGLGDRGGNPTKHTGWRLLLLQQRQAFCLEGGWVDPVGVTSAGSCDTHV